uniref:Ig-like domain-containing protein n=1 Tax=Oreochromis niloticus TaxID=8128 RepID=A0A669CJV0_ORENI
MWQDIMEVRALCIRLLITVLILLCAHAQKVDAVSLRVVPNKSQFFEHESVSFYCEESSHGYVLYKKNEEVKQCNKTSRKPTASTTGSQCTIDRIYRYDNGEYWCGTAGGKRSNNINITVTAGSVILESPAVPVMEGEAVTLRCRNKTASSNFTSNFYKDGAHVHSNATEDMIIQKVSKSDEGLYTCNISGGGQSPESWLSVTETKTDPSSQPSCHIYLILRTVFTIIMVALLLLLVGLLHSGKIGATNPNLSSIP